MHSRLVQMKVLVGHWTIKLGRQNRRLLHWPNVQLSEYKKQTLEAFVAETICMPSLILCMIVKLALIFDQGAYYLTKI